jgi:hypothetical protein
MSRQRRAPLGFRNRVANLPSASVIGAFLPTGAQWPFMRFASFTETASPGIAGVTRPAVLMNRALEETSRRVFVAIFKVGSVGPGAGLEPGDTEGEAEGEAKGDPEGETEGELEGDGEAEGELEGEVEDEPCGGVEGAPEPLGAGDGHPLVQGLHEGRNSYAGLLVTTRRPLPSAAATTISESTSILVKTREEPSGDHQGEKSSPEPGSSVVAVPFFRMV